MKKLAKLFNSELLRPGGSRGLRFKGVNLQKKREWGRGGGRETAGLETICPQCVRTERYQAVEIEPVPGFLGLGVYVWGGENTEGEQDSKGTEWGWAHGKEKAAERQDW